jgi:hypothetical protein
MSNHLGQEQIQHPEILLCCQTPTKILWLKSPHMPLRFVGDINRLWHELLKGLKGAKF